MLKVYKKLFSSLHENKIVFCNWKGHADMECNLEGKGDLDTFIPLSFKNKFEKIASKIGFINVVSYQANHDFIEHYFGYDSDTNKFAHLHVYFKIVTGESATKNYILPIESYLVSNINNYSHLPIPNKKARKVIFLLRHFLKIGSLYGLLQYRREKDKYLREWSALDYRIDFDDLPALNLSAKDLYSMEEIYSSKGYIRNIYSAYIFKWKMMSYRRRSFLRYQNYVIKNFLIRLSNRLIIRRKKLLKKGAVVAICGLDGSGKSTLINHLNNNFSEHFSVKSLHLGRPPSTFLTFAFKLLLNARNFIRSYKKKGSVNVIDVKSEFQITTLHAFRAVILAYERKALSNKAHKLSEKGYLVICDRYPGLNYGKMDSPRILYNDSRSWLYKYLHNIEKSLYHQIQPAHNILHLDVPLEISIKRNNARSKIGKETNEEIEERFRVNHGVKFLANQYNIVNANIPFYNVLSEVSETIWRYLQSNNND